MSKRKKKNRHSHKPIENRNEQRCINSKETEGYLITTAQKYHLSYASEIAYEIEFHNHLSVLMPALIGLHPLALNIYDGLSFRCREYVIVERQEDIDIINEMLISAQDENKCIYPILYEEFIESVPEGGCYVLFDLPQEKRMEVSSILCSRKDIAVISIGKLQAGDTVAKSSMVNQAQEAMNELYQITLKNGRPHCMIFPVESVLDVRDLMYANATEKTKLVSALYDICSDYEIDYGVTDQITSASGNAEKIAQYKRMLAERDFEISILKSVAASAGVNISGLENGIERITRMKHEYGEKFDKTTDLQEQEKLEVAFQNEVSVLLTSITSEMMTLTNKEHYERMLIDQLSESVWKKKISERSRTYLISAMMIFDSMNKLSDNDKLDYSGVCLQITKVLDEEMTLRFYTKYKRYLYTHYLLDNWPNAMRSKYGDEPLAPNDFTIGTIAYVIGVGEQGRVYNSKAFEMVQEFAKANLYEEGMSDQEIRDHLIKCVECTEKTRKDYRNPAAHREAVSYISAKECIGYLIEQTKMLKQILQDMRE